MAILKCVDKPSNSKGGAYGVLEYVGSKSEKTEGLYCHDDWKKAFANFQDTKKFYEKETGRQYLHDIVSFAPNETTPEKAFEITKKYAQENYKGHEVYLALHTDKEHLHVHMVINSVNFETGYKFQRSKSKLRDQKKNLTVELEKNGLTPPEKKNEKGEIRAYEKNKYQLLMKKKGESDIGKLAISYMKNLEKSKDKSEFIKLMAKDGYSTDWQENKKNIVFTISEEKLSGKKNKFRLSNIQKTFSLEEFDKSKLLENFEKNKQKTQEQKSNVLDEMKKEISADNIQNLKKIKEEIAKANKTKISAKKAQKMPKKEEEFER